MFTNLYKYIEKLFKTVMSSNPGHQNGRENSTSIPLKSNYNQNLADIKNALQGNYDLVIREFNVGGAKKLPVFIVYISSIVDEARINDSIISPLMTLEIENQPVELDLNYIQTSILSTVNVTQVSDLTQVVDNLVNGETILFYKDSGTALSIDCWYVKGRDIEKPETETVIRGPKESFNEGLEENVALLRRKIRNPNLKLQSYDLGAVTKTEVIIAYIDGIVDPAMVREIKERIESIDIDAILESGYIEELIEDAPYSPFPTVGNTENQINWQLIC